MGPGKPANPSLGRERPSQVSLFCRFRPCWAEKRERPGMLKKRAENSCFSPWGCGGNLRNQAGNCPLERAVSVRRQLRSTAAQRRAAGAGPVTGVIATALSAETPRPSGGNHRNDTHHWLRGCASCQRPLLRRRTLASGLAPGTKVRFIPLAL